MSTNTTELHRHKNMALIRKK